MITILTGENTYEVDNQLSQIVKGFAGVVERIDGSRLEQNQLADTLMGTTLFADKRLVVIKDLSENKAIWPNLIDWIPRLSDDIELVLIESKLDKRTSTYKELKKIATIKEYSLWTSHDQAEAERWLENQADLEGLRLNKKFIQQIIQRVGLDQWALSHAVEKLTLVGTITEQVIEDIIDVAPSENAFNLFDAALRGDKQKVAIMIRVLKATDDPFRLFALLSGQAFQLATLAVSHPGDLVAKDLGANPFVISKLKSSAKRLGRSGARKIIAAFAKADDDMKLSRADPWLLIERALMQVAII